jgi:hypothetical protein
MQNAKNVFGKICVLQIWIRFSTLILVRNHSNIQNSFRCLNWIFKAGMLESEPLNFNWLLQATNESYICSTRPFKRVPMNILLSLNTQQRKYHNELFWGEITNESYFIPTVKQRRKRREMARYIQHASSHILTSRQSHYISEGNLSRLGY